MMSLLFSKEILPNIIITSPTGYNIGVNKDQPLRESWMGIYFKDTKIGFTNTVIMQDVDEGVPGYRIHEFNMLKLNILGENKLIRIKGDSFFSENHILQNFIYKLFSDMYTIEVSGRKKGDRMHIAIDSPFTKLDKEIEVKGNTLLSNSISPLFLFKQLDARRELHFNIFDPITLSTYTLMIKHAGSDFITYNGVQEEADIFEIDFNGIKTKTWMTKDGDILKEESALGFTMHKEDSKTALNLTPSTTDFLSGFCISAVAMPNPRGVSYMKIKKDGLIVEIHKDKEPEKEKTLRIPIQEIPEEPFIQSKDKRIIKLAQEIVGDEKNSWVSAQKILTWVYKNIRKTPTLSIPSSLDVLAMRQGDCNEHTVLFTALARSIGIPVKMIAGVVYIENGFYYHAWPEVYVGAWISMDPTLGQTIADATHVALLEGGIKEQLALIKIIENLKIKILDYR